MPDHQRQRRQHGRIGEPLDARVLHCYGIVATACPGVARERAILGGCWFHRSAGAAVASRAGGSRCARAAAALLRRLAPDPVLLSGVRVWAPVAYSGPARDLVRALKFRGRDGALADAMAAQIVANAPPELLDREPGGPALVPVPLHPRRLRLRGYNQAALIAAALATRTGLVVADCLARSGSAATQVGRGPRRAAPQVRRAASGSGAGARSRAVGGRRGHHGRHARRVRRRPAGRRRPRCRRRRVRSDDRALMICFLLWYLG